MEHLKGLVARVLNVDESKINDEASPSSIDSWDSFNGLMLVVELEKSFNVKFTTEEVTSITKFKDIKDTLAKHGIKRGLL